MSDLLEARVRRAYDAAAANGYSIDYFATSGAFAEDMISYDADLESEDSEAIANIIDKIRSEER